MKMELQPVITSYSIHYTKLYDEEQELSVNRTITWAKRCRDTFDQIVKDKKIPVDKKPLLFDVIQGGGIHELRKKCADASYNFV